MRAAPKILRTLVLLAAVTTLAACGADAEPLPQPTPLAGINSYVALGDSFVGGPGIDPVDQDSGACHRSQRNYPSLLAARLGVDEFTDGSCAATTSAEILEQAQDALADADLITIGTGGNDGLLYEKLFTGCYFPDSRSAQACSDVVDRDAAAILSTTTTQLTRALRDVRDAAPRARILLIGYLRYLPDSGPCAALDLDESGVARVLTVQKAIDAAQQQAAKAAGIDFISLHDASRGHDACAKDQAWVRGLDGTTTDGTALHPTAAGMRAVAQAIDTHLRAATAPGS